jgi:hypothetical protein
MYEAIEAPILKLGGSVVAQLQTRNTDFPANRDEKLVGRGYPDALAAWRLSATADGYA